MIIVGPFATTIHEKVSITSSPMGNNRSPENNHSTCKNVGLRNQVFNDHLGMIGRIYVGYHYSYCTQNIKALDLMVSEKMIFFAISYCLRAMMTPGAWLLWTPGA